MIWIPKFKGKIKGPIPTIIYAANVFMYVVDDEIHYYAKGDNGEIITCIIIKRDRDL